MSSRVRSKQQYYIIGKLLMRRNPEMAQSLLTEIAINKPAETDFTRIETYFSAYCQLNDLPKTELIGQILKKSKVEHRRIIVSIILHLYSPSSFNQPSGKISITRGLLTSLSILFKISRGYLWKFTMEVISMERFYDQFRDQVKAMQILLTQNTNHGA